MKYWARNPGDTGNSVHLGHLLDESLEFSSCGSVVSGHSFPFVSQMQLSGSNLCDIYYK